MKREEVSLLPPTGLIMDFFQKDNDSIANNQIFPSPSAWNLSSSGGSHAKIHEATPNKNFMQKYNGTDTLDDDANTLIDLWDRMPKRRKVNESHADIERPNNAKDFVNYNPGTKTFTRSPPAPPHSFTYSPTSNHSFTTPPSTPQHHTSTSPYAPMRTTPSPTQRSPASSVHSSPRAHTPSHTPSHTPPHTPSHTPPLRSSGSRSSPNQDFASIFGGSQLSQNFSTQSQNQSQRQNQNRQNQNQNQRQTQLNLQYPQQNSHQPNLQNSHQTSLQNPHQSNLHNSHQSNLHNTLQHHSSSLLNSHQSNLQNHQSNLQINPHQHGLHSQFSRPHAPPDLSQLILPQHPHTTFPKLAQPAYSPMPPPPLQAPYTQFLQPQQSITNGNYNNFYPSYETPSNSLGLPKVVVTESITYQKFDPSKSIAPLSLDAIHRNWDALGLPQPHAAAYNHSQSTHSITQTSTSHSHSHSLPQLSHNFPQPSHDLPHLHDFPQPPARAAAPKKPRQARPKKLPQPPPPLPTAYDSPAPATPPVATPPHPPAYLGNESEGEDELALEAERRLEVDLWDLQKQIACANKLIKEMDVAPVELVTVMESKPEWIFDLEYTPDTSTVVQPTKPKKRDDYWDTDEEEEWESIDAYCPPPHINVEEYNMRYVHAHYTQIELIGIELCRLCGSKGDNNHLLFCMGCGECYHTFCIGVPNTLTPQHKSQWRCPHCKMCELCVDTGHEDELFMCDECDKGYHTFCLSLSEVPSERWVCPACTNPAKIEPDAKIAPVAEIESDTKSEREAKSESNKNGAAETAKSEPETKSEPVAVDLVKDVPDLEMNAGESQNGNFPSFHSELPTLKEEPVQEVDMAERPNLPSPGPSEGPSASNSGPNSPTPGPSSTTPPTEPSSPMSVTTPPTQPSTPVTTPPSSPRPAADSRKRKARVNDDAEIAQQALATDGRPRERRATRSVLYGGRKPEKEDSPKEKGKGKTTKEDSPKEKGKGKGKAKEKEEKGKGKAKEEAVKTEKGKGNAKGKEEKGKAKAKEAEKEVGKGKKGKENVKEDKHKGKAEKGTVKEEKGKVKQETGKKGKGKKEGIKGEKEAKGKKAEEKQEEKQEEGEEAKEDGPKKRGRKKGWRKPKSETNPSNVSPPFISPITSPLTTTPPPISPDNDQSAADLRRCTLCPKKGDTPIEGRLLPAALDMWVHLNCALWSSEVSEVGEGALGAVYKAIARGKRYKCTECKKYGATLGCDMAKCANIYHFGCAMATRCVFQLDAEGTRQLLCSKHSHLIAGTVEVPTRPEIAANKFFLLKQAEVGPQTMTKQNSLIGTNYTMMPGATLRVGTLTVHNLGEIYWFKPTYHTRNYIYPVGYTSTRFHWSMNTLGERWAYLCEIGDGDDKPIFTVTPQRVWVDGRRETIEEVEPILGDSPEEVWTKVSGKINELRTNTTLSKITTHEMTGYDFFGLNHPTVVRMIEELPNVRYCAGYQFDFDWVKLRIPRDRLPDYKGDTQGVLDDAPQSLTGCARTEGIVKEELGRYKIRKLIKKRGRGGGRLLASTQQAGGRGEREADTPVLTQQQLQQELLQTKDINGLPIPMQYRLLKQRWKSKAPWVRMGRSPIHEWGVFTSVHMKEGTLVLEYVGEIIRQKVADLREKMYDAKGRGCYMFRMDDDNVVDATCRGNITRFVNHCCEPNCIARVHNIEGKKHILLFTKRAVALGEELTYDYMFSYEDDDSKIPCCCGAPKCRGTMN